MEDFKLGTYQHFKGDLVEVMHVAHDSEDPQKEWVVYSHRDKIWVRPLEMFLERVERDGYSGPRFVLVQALEK